MIYVPIKIIIETTDNIINQLLMIFQQILNKLLKWFLINCEQKGYNKDEMTIQEKEQNNMKEV